MNSNNNLLKTTAVFLIIESLLIFFPLVILGNSINWPASLDQSAKINLPIILEHYSSMILGYSIYLIYSLLFWPVAYLTGRVIAIQKHERTLVKIANGFAILSVMSRCLGIVRWLFAMPILAKFYIDSKTAQITKNNISIIYEILNSYAGGIGELLGVSLFTVLWLVLISILILRTKEYPKWLGYFGFITALCLFMNLGEVIDIDMGPMITISTSLLQFWMFTTAIVLIVKIRKKKTPLEH